MGLSRPSQNIGWLTEKANATIIGAKAGRSFIIIVTPITGDEAPCSSVRANAA